MGIEFKALDNDALLAEGRKAIRQGRESEFKQIVTLLEGRSSRLAGENAEILRREFSARGPKLSKSTLDIKSGSASSSSRTIKASSRPQLVFDGDISTVRDQLIRGAKQSIWLSSLTPPSDQLVEILCKKQKEGVDVNLIVAERTIMRRHERHLDKMDRIGVNWVLPDSTHSKILVVDRAFVLIGSANAHGGHRDAACLFRDETEAARAVDYLTVIDEEVK